MQNLVMDRIAELGSPKVLVVGDFMLDAYLFGDADRISPEAPVPVLKVVREEYRCGGASSVAAALAALGATPVCIGVVGNDASGRQLTSLLEQLGADTSGLCAMAGRPTITKQRLVGVAQHRHQQQLMRVDFENDQPLESSAFNALLDCYTARLADADAVCLQDYGKGLFNDERTRQLIAKARQAGKQTLVDPRRGANYEQYRAATVITPNRFEASQAVGFPIKNVQDARRAADILFDTLEFDTVVITLDRDGAFVKSHDLAECVPTQAKSVYDVTGAGDVVLAALAVALAAGWDGLAATQLANLAAGIAIGKFGTATATIDEIIHQLLVQSKGQAGKVLPLDSLLRVLKWHRDRDETIVFTNGCFDVLHEGHTSCLSFCKKQGDVLVVGLNSDASVRQLKGPDRPVNSEVNRASVLAALEAIDYVAIFDDEAALLDLITKIQPNVFAKGEDYKDRDVDGVVGRRFVESYGGRFVLIPLVQGLSSSSTIARIRGGA